uniref:Alpha 1,4-glycosyltransferase domain-containing protein n=1 Tax=Cryptomonas curvata TaxID=233186 RepID=A0A7S0N915_9CRYP
MQALRDLGGIYMDLDVITIRPFTPLMNASFVMGHEGEGGVFGLCNAVLLSAPASPFVRLWIDYYAEAYDPAIWSMHSVKLPSMLGHLYPEHLTQVHHKTFFYPLWDGLDHLFRGHGDDFSDNIAMHLWESLSYDRFLANLTLAHIRKVDTNFNRAVRRFVD